MNKIWQKEIHYYCKQMLKAYKYRLVPNVKQSILLSKTMGSVRYFWNKQVEVFNTYDKESNPKPTYKTSTEFRNEIKWLQEVSAAAIQQKEIDFKKFRKQFFSKSRKERLGRPKFKKRNENNSFRLPNQKFSINQNTIKLEKIGNVKYVQDRELPSGKLMSVTISKDATGKYFASVLIETTIEHKQKTGLSIGIDVGLKEFATLSDGKVIANPNYFRNSQAELRKAQKRLNRKKKGSFRYTKCKIKVARIHKKIANQRNHFLHIVSSKIVNDYDLISIEDLNVKGIVKNRKLSKSISDASFSMFFSMLKYKCEWYGKELVKIDRFAPSSKTCSNCGSVKTELKLSERVYKCKCGFEMDRDLNASKNINAMGVDIAKRA
jgi:putative transposase